MTTQRRRKGATVFLWCDGAIMVYRGDHARSVERPTVASWLRMRDLMNRRGLQLLDRGAVAKYRYEGEGAK